MKKIIVLVLIGVLGWQGYQKFEHRQARPREVRLEQRYEPSLPLAAKITRSTSYNCDGRTYCSQMTSCDEATYFLKNCPDTKMDGNGDGVPCEKQWCR